MLTAAAAVAFAAAGTAVISAIAAITASAVFSAKVMAGTEERFAFAAGKNGIGLFIKTKTGGGVASFFESAMMTNKVAV